MLLPSTDEEYLANAQAVLLEEAFEEIKEIFHASGVGLPLSYLDKGTGAFIRAIIGLFDVPSEHLVLFCLYISHLFRLISMQVLKTPQRRCPQSGKISSSQRTVSYCFYFMLTIVKILYIYLQAERMTKRL
jgi:hypothetical protein